jgi:hypothetical protein
MAESFGNTFTVVEVTADGASAAEPETQLWIAVAKPAQALTLVLAAVPEGWTAELLDAHLTERQQRTFAELNLKPGDVYRLPERQGRLSWRPLSLIEHVGGLCGKSFHCFRIIEWKL